MIILGLAGKARSGKDTVADFLVKRYGFIKFAFSDALYQEVQDAYGLEDQSLLRNAETKEAPQHALRLRYCSDLGFIHLAHKILAGEYPDAFFPLDELSLSPRQILQWWGTEYRREQDPDYWVKKTAERLDAFRAAFRYPEQVPQFFVNPTCRFPNERAWIRGQGGNVWHVHREGVPGVAAHVSEGALPVQDGEREIWNNDTVARLCDGVDLLMRTGARFVRVEPMEEPHE